MAQLFPQLGISGQCYAYCGGLRNVYGLFRHEYRHKRWLFPNLPSTFEGLFPVLAHDRCTVVKGTRGKPSHNRAGGEVLVVELGISLKLQTTNGKSRRQPLVLP